MTAMGMHPIFLLMAVIGIVTGLYSLYVSIPVLMPILFAASMAGLLARLAMLALEGRRQKHADAAIDFGF